MARTRVASPFAKERGRVSPSENVLPGGIETLRLNPLPLAKRRGETNGMELTTGEHYLAAGVILLCRCPVEIKTGTIGRA
jgi:hypothetical protein